MSVSYRVWLMPFMLWPFQRMVYMTPTEYDKWVSIGRPWRKSQDHLWRETGR